MFRRRRGQQASGSGRTKILLTDMKLIDIPPSQNLLYLKVKQGRTGAETRKFPIVKNSVSFKEPLLFEYEMPRRPTSRNPKPLRLSFRVENPLSSGFTRYGIAELDIMQLILDGASEIRVLLPVCSYNTWFTANFQLPEGSPFPREAAAPAPTDNIAQPSWSNTSDVSPTSSVSSVSEKSSSSSNSNRLYDTAPVKLPRETFDLLERQVDDILAGIITADEEKRMQH
jgi:hypothetical protein